MITRPLDLASRLRPEPRSFDWLFFVNGGFIVLYFFLFGSQFVVAPALGIDFQLPTEGGAVAEARSPTSFVSVTESGQIFAGDGLRSLDQLQGWLRDQAKSTRRQPVLLVRASKGVKFSLLTEITTAARAAGFVGVMYAADKPSTELGGP